MPFLWNRGFLHKHAWKCSDCGFTIEFNTKEWAYREIREHRKSCPGRGKSRELKAEGNGEKVDFQKRSINRSIGATRQSGLKDRTLDPGQGIQPHQPPIRCPECTSQRVWRDGLRKTRHGDVQRWLCRSCGFRFSESTANPEVKVHVSSQVVEKLDSRKDFPNPYVAAGDLVVQPFHEDPLLKGSEDVGSHQTHQVSITVKDLNSFRGYSRERRVCVSEVEMKNLVEVETRKKWAAGATKPDPATIKGKILEHSFWMLKQGYKEGTIKQRAGTLMTLVRRGADLFDPESVKETIAKQPCGDGRKAIMVQAYTSFLIMQGLTWIPPIYKPPQKIPFIPTEQEVDQLIASCGKITGTFYQLVKETGARPGEIWRLRWIDVDGERRLVTINSPEKGSNPRMLPISKELIARLERLPKHSEKIFRGSLVSVSDTSYKQRRRASLKLGNPRIRKISFRTLRHWKGTMEYHKTKDIIHVMRVLGHKNINNTLIYINLEAAVFATNADEFHVRVTESVEEMTKLLEVGYEYVCEHKGAKIFRKRK